MTMSGALARPMMAGIFIYGGIDALCDPESKAKAADEVVPMLVEALGLPATDTVTLVRVNGGIQVVAGSLLALGKGRRLAALVLAASLIPTTYAGHRFWEELDEERRHQQRIQFLKNLAMIGGLILAAGDTGGRPSIPWQAGQVAKHAIETTAAAGTATTEAARQVVGATKDRSASAASAVAANMPELGRRARKAAAKAQEAAAKAQAKAQQADLAEQARRAVAAAKESELTKKALKAAQKAAKSAQKSDLSKRAVKAAQRAAKSIDDADLGRHAAEMATKAQQAAADGWDQLLEMVAEANLPRTLEGASSAARDLVERARESLPVAS